jgi:UDP-N-acetyl-D-glucosamine dehydrogenase
MSTHAHTTSDLKTALLRRIESRTARVGVVGAGYVGLPLALELVRNGFATTVLDLCSERIQKLTAGKSYISDVTDGDLVQAWASEKFSVTLNYADMAAMDIIVLALPTPLSRDGQPNLGFIDDAALSLQPHLRPGQLVSLESTTYPGTTEERLLPILLQDGMIADRDLYLVYSPERMDPGNQKYSLRTTSRLLAGVGPHSAELGKTFYEHGVGAPIHLTSGTRVAELAKLYENAFRLVNIALVNEMAMLCDKIQLNVWEVLSAANTKPFGILNFFPSPGAGGHCIPLDPQYLAWKANQANSQSELISVASRINSAMPQFVVEKISRLLHTDGKTVATSRILLMGITYKPDIADIRESASLAVMKLLLELGGSIDYCDPFIPQLRSPHVDATSIPPSCLTDDGFLSCYDLVVILTNHSCFDYLAVVKASHRVLDTRNATGSIAEYRDKIVLL